MRSQEIPELKLLFREEGVLVAAVQQIGDKFIIHSENLMPFSKSNLQFIQTISMAIDEEFKARGVDKLYTWAETDEQYRYNMFLGYKPNGKEVIIPNYDKTVYEFEKDLM